MDRKLTLKEIDQEITKLKQLADKIRDTEKAGVVARMRAAVDYYGITAADLGLGKRGKRAESKAKPDSVQEPDAKATPKATTVPGRIKYRDGAGHAWSGFGPKPRWLVEALASGKTEAELRA